MNYYNEFNKHAAQWLRNLIEAGHIAPGVVDERSIEDVQPDDLRGYTQCHFFAGIGVWPLALRRAGWADDRPVWTGSCPCQPFSAVGKGAGFADERHLWPAFYHLIDEHAKWCRKTKRPIPTVFGEQVASKDVDAWIDLVQDDLEAMGYVVGAIPFPSAGIGAPHIRDRTYWVAIARAAAGGMGHADFARLERLARHGGAAGRKGPKRPVAEASLFGGLADDNSFGQQSRAGAGLHDAQRDAESRSSSIRLADTDNSGQQRRRTGEEGDGGDAARIEPERFRNAGGSGQSGPTNGHWRDADWLFCRDGKWRPVEPGTFPLVDGLADRVGRVRTDWRAPAGKDRQGHRAGRLKGYGNAINLYQAIEFISVVQEALSKP